MRPPKPRLVASPEWTPRGRRRMVDLPVSAGGSTPMPGKTPSGRQRHHLLYPAMPLELHCSATPLELHCSARPLELQCSAKPLEPHCSATPLELQCSARPLEPHCSARPLELRSSERPLELHCSAKPLGLHCSARPLELPCSARPLELHCASRSVAGLTWPAFVYSNHQVTGSYYALQSACSAECLMPFWTPHCLYHVTFFFFVYLD